LASIGSLEALAARCGGFVSRDEPNLYFPAVGLDGIGAAPWFFALALRTTMAHIRGQARLDCEPVPERPNHFDFVRYLAARDPANFPPGQWQAQYRELANTPDGTPFPIP
jgi:hypothetical protein